jgi:hypothetical protein
MVDGVADNADREFVKRHHVHYSVAPDWVAGREGRWSVGFEVRLFAVQGKGAGGLPGGPRSRALVRRLGNLAQALLPDCRTMAHIDFDPFRPALYDSSEVPGADEVALTMRLLHCSEDYSLPVDAAQERCLREIRRRLKLLSIPER